MGYAQKETKETKQEIVMSDECNVKRNSPAEGHGLKIDYVYAGSLTVSKTFLMMSSVLTPSLAAAKLQKIR